MLESSPWPSTALQDFTDIWLQALGGSGYEPNVVGYHVHTIAGQVLGADRPMIISELVEVENFFTAALAGANVCI